MKILITTFAIAFCSFGNIFAQITYETTYLANVNNCLLGRIKINQSSTKYLTANYSPYSSLYSYNVTYKLYNLNHSLYKTLPLITDTMKHMTASPISIQENLFNTDGNIEIAYIKYKENSNYVSFKIIDEYGTVIFERDSVKEFNSNVLNNLQLQGVFNSESGAKLILPLESFGSNGPVPTKEIYSLGGTVITTNIINKNEEEYFMELSPNPAREFTRINYQIPTNEANAEIIVFDLNGNEIKRFTVDKTFNDLIISNEDLPSGSYFYTLYANNQIIGTKKSFVIK